MKVAFFVKPTLRQPIQNGCLYLQCEPRLQAENAPFLPYFVAIHFV